MLSELSQALERYTLNGEAPMPFDPVSDSMLVKLPDMDDTSRSSYLYRALNALHDAARMAVDGLEDTQTSTYPSSLRELAHASGSAAIIQGLINRGVQPEFEQEAAEMLFALSDAMFALIKNVELLRCYKARCEMLEAAKLPEYERLERALRLVDQS